MSHNTRRLARLAAGLAVTAAATTLLGAAPAHAQTTAVTARVSSGTLIVTGTSFGDIVSATGGFGRISLGNLTGAIRDGGAGCTQLGGNVECTGVNSISFSGLGGVDKFDGRSVSLTPISMSGGAGNDILFGGSGDDRLSGGSGTDRADGQGGTDTCFAETEAACER
jgi:Ca2+-binding RTX toxin-like protein